MNPVTEWILTFQQWVAQVPELLQPVIVALAGAVPFIEGEGSALIGIIGGINPVVAAIAGIVGNLLCVIVVVLVSARIRKAVTDRVARKATVGPNGEIVEASAEDAEPETARGQKVRRAFEKYGTPGVSLLGPLLVPTQFTAATLTGLGVSPARVIAWQAVAITMWTVAVTLIITGVITFAS